MKALKHILLLSLLSSSLVIANEQALLLIEVENHGIQRVNAQDVQNKGLEIIGLEAKDLGLFKNGKSVPMFVDNLSNGAITADSRIEFIGSVDENLYQKHTNYYLKLAAGVEINEYNLLNQNTDTIQVYEKQEVIAPNQIYNIGSNTNDPWHAINILAIDTPVTKTMEFQVANKSAQNTEVQLDIVLFGGTDYPQHIDHYVEVSLNGKLLGSYSFDGLETQNLSYKLSSESFLDGTNTISIHVPNSTGVSADLIQIESWSIKYLSDLVFSEQQLITSKFFEQQTQSNDSIFRAGFDLEQKSLVIKNAQQAEYLIYQSNASNHTRVKNYTLSDSCAASAAMSCELRVAVHDHHLIYIANEQTVHKPTIRLPAVHSDILFQNAQYLIIAHPDFINADLNTYVSYKSSDYKVQVVDVEQIYAQFGFYNKSAEAIDEYIRHAATQMGTEFVMLVGGDTYDYHNYLNLGSISFIPSLYMATDNLIKFAPVDSKYADINDDNIPDISIGRLPVRTEQDLSVLLNKIYLYDQKTYSQTALISADKFDSSQIYSFSADAESMINTLPDTWKNNITDDYRAFIDNDGLNLAQSKIINGINNGVSLTSFIGHSGTRAWSFSRLLRNSHVSSLTNSDKPTVVTQWGCWNSYFVSPQEDTMAHAFMLNPNGGAVASLGASTLTTADMERQLSQLVFNELVNNRQSLGKAVQLAKQQLAQTNPTALDVILGWNILGDPTIRLE